MNDRLLVDRRGSCAWLTLNRPHDGNCIDAGLAGALGDAAAQCAEDETIRCVVLTGAGRMFCSGGDIKAFIADSHPSVAIDSITSRLHPAIERLTSMPKPLVTLVNGPAAGAGLGLAMIGDLVIAARSAHFTSAYTAIGLTPDGSSSWFLPRLIGYRRAFEMVLTNRRVGAEEAERLGLVTRVVDDDRLEEEGMAAAGALASSAIGALANARVLFAASFGNSLSEHLAIEARTIAARAETAEGREGVASFIDKRKPSFS